MSGPRIMRLYDRDEEPAASKQPGFRQELPSGAATVRADEGGNIVAVEVDPRRLQAVSPEAFAAQLTAAIQQVQQRAENQQQQALRRNQNRKE